MDKETLEKKGNIIEDEAGKRIALYVGCQTFRSVLMLMIIKEQGVTITEWSINEQLIIL